MSHAALSSIGSSLFNAGRALGHSALQLRCYLLPSHIGTYFKIVRQNGGQNGSDGKFVFFDFTRGEIDSVSGRYLFGLVRDFEALGYQPCYRKNFCFLATMEHKRFKNFLMRLPFRVCESVNELPAGSVAAVVTDRGPGASNGAARRIRVRYEAVWPKSDREVAMTFFVHPAIHRQWLTLPPPDLDGPRRWRVFFAGRIQKWKYGTGLLPRKFGKMSRQQIMRALENSLPADRFRRVNSAADLEPGPATFPGLVWSELTHYMIPRPEWLNVLNGAEFFLACPGTHMPLCHNLVEAMSRGVVPILEHPEFLDPPLEHDVNCLVFRGRDELIKLFERVFQFSPAEIHRLRHGAYAYYQQHFAPGAFARRLLNSPHTQLDLLLNAYRAPRRPRS